MICHESGGVNELHAYIIGDFLFIRAGHCGLIRAFHCSSSGGGGGREYLLLSSGSPYLWCD
jgi:hypothetical protein